MKRFLSTKDVAEFLSVNEKMVYALVSDKGLPATKVTGKWLFPKHLVEQWVEANTVNFPDASSRLPPYTGLLIIAGSNDLLLDKTISLFNSRHREHLAVFGNLGSVGGIRALKRGLCHVASSHLLQENGNEYNFDFASRELNRMPAVINFCRREQGLMIHQSNPFQIRDIRDMGARGLRMINRPLSTGTRHLFDRELKKAGINGEKIKGYHREMHRHMDVGLEILAGRADAAPGIRPVAEVLGLDFIPIRWERFDLLIAKEKFFEQGVQLFQSLLQESEFISMAQSMGGYDVQLSGKMVFPEDPSEG